MSLTRIGVTPGDPSGIGPEIILKAFSRTDLLPAARYILFISPGLLEAEQRSLGREFRPGRAEFSGGEEGSLELEPLEEPSSPILRGAPSVESGRLSFLYFQAAVEAARQGQLEAVVTAPISKQSWHLAGLKWRGHTEYLDHHFPGAVMAFWSERLKVALLSHHLPLKEALGLVREDILLEFFIHLRECFRKTGLEKVKFLLAGLNPHAGEGGVLGQEEEREIVPAVRKARLAGVDISDPIPPDVVFRRALDRPGTVVIALYHDQGLIAFKLMAFETGVNVSLGLPFVRTSPDHGTAFDIVGRDAADPSSLVEALRLARRLSPASL